TLDHLVAVALRDPNELLENVARQALEAAIDARDARRRIHRLGASPENFGLDIVTGMTAHVLDEPLENLGVARFVPNLSRHIELELPRRVGKIEQRAARRFHRLQLAGVDAVQSRAQRFFVERHRAAGVETLLLADFAHLAAAQHNPIVGAGKAVNGDAFLHDTNSSVETTTTRRA